MTTIAYRDGVLAADSGSWLSNVGYRTAHKLAIGPDGSLHGVCGNAGDAETYLAWVRDGMNGPPPKPESTDRVEGRSAFLALVVGLHGEVSVWSAFGREHHHDCKYLALAPGQKWPSAPWLPERRQSRQLPSSLIIPATRCSRSEPSRGPPPLSLSSPTRRCVRQEVITTPMSELPVPGPGRDSKYDPSMNDQARKLALLGLTDDEMAEFFGVHPSTLYRWKADIPAFREAVMEGKVVADAEVANSLYKRATGEFVEFQKSYRNKDSGEIEIITLKSWNPGDPGAAKLWLTNRRPQDWRDKQSVEHTFNHEQALDELDDEPDGAESAGA